jgi:hypothetical protein
MRTWKASVLAGLTFMALAGGAYLLSRDNDPVYQGKPLSEHLKAFSAADGISSGYLSSDSTVVLPGVQPHCSDEGAREALQEVGKYFGCGEQSSGKDQGRGPYPATFKISE